MEKTEKVGKNFWLTKRDNERITNRDRFKGLEIGARGITNRDSFRDFKLRQEGAGWGGAGITNRCRTLISITKY